MKYNKFIVIGAISVLMTTIMAYGAMVTKEERDLANKIEKPPGLKAGSSLIDCTGTQWIIENRELEGAKEDGIWVYKLRISFSPQNKELK